MSIDANSEKFSQIPQPPSKRLVGNLLDVSHSTPVQSFMGLAREYGPIFKLDLPDDRHLVLISDHKLVDELSDETRFDKKVWRPLQNVRAFAGDGLFTAHTQEANWHKAHNILMPNFSMKAMQGYFPMMLDIAEQLMEKWERLNADEEIDVPNDMTRLTLDTIGLCGFDYRFNSFYRENMHPFVQAMVGALGESMARNQRLPVQERVMIHKHIQMQRDIDFLNNMVDRIIKERKENGAQSGKKDLLAYMLSGVDKETGEKLDDINIRYQIITFLIAGHETTSGLLSFAIYYLLNNPEVLAKAYEEVDHVLGNDPSISPTFQQINHLHYTSQILKESLRLWPTAPLFSVYPYEDTVIGGKYKVDRSNEWSVLIPMLHRDPSVWGENADQFNPDNFLPEREQRRPVNAYKPFGNGQRACIGRQFAMQEAVLVLAMILQRFKLVDHQNYQLKIKESLTLKPENFFIKVRPRTDADRTVIVTPKKEEQTISVPKPVATKAVKKHHTPLLVLYGSNLGTAEDIAHHIAEDGEANGFDSVVATLDEYTNQLPKEGAVVMASASYNGTAPDNAAKFTEWLKKGEMGSNALHGVKYTIFGCGNREWASTFQAIPRLIDSDMEQYGAQRIYLRGEGDASDDFDGQFQAWYGPLWNTLAEKLHIDLDVESSSARGPMYAVEVLPEGQVSNPFVASFGAMPTKVLVNRELHEKTGEWASPRSTRHIELELSKEITYRAGDHLGVVGRNHEEQVRRVAAHFGFDHNSKIIIHRSDTRKTNLPMDEPVRVFDLLTDYIELQEVVTRKQIRALVDATECPPDKLKLEVLSGDSEESIAKYRSEVLEKRKSLIDLLEEFPACEMPFNVYLELLSPIRVRYYSISSSPLKGEDRCSITVGEVRGPALSGHGEYHGLCSGFLVERSVGEIVHAFVRDTKSSFRMIEDTTKPLIMVGPGTGLAPYMGFLQEREVLKSQSKDVAKSLLFFGCRHPQQDFIYRDELERYVDRGLIDLFVAFSRENPSKKVYVQDKIREQKDQIWQALLDGGVIYICGDARKMAPDVRQAFDEIYRDKTGESAEDAEKWLNEMNTSGRYLVDVWGN